VSLAEEMTRWKERVMIEMLESTSRADELRERKEMVSKIFDVHGWRCHDDLKTQIQKMQFFSVYRLVIQGMKQTVSQELRAFQVMCSSLLEAIGRLEMVMMMS
jgi:hypothetical protein